MAGKSNLKLWVVAGDASFAGPKPSVLPGESVGLFLRLLRERAGLTVQEAAAQVRIREAYIQAIEDDRFESLPGRAYAQGFVRAYAEFLGADVESTARAAIEDIGKLPSALPIAPASLKRNVRPRAAPLAAAAICLALAGYVYWYFENTKSRFEDAAQTLARVDAPDFVEGSEPRSTIATGPYRPFPDAVPPSERTDRRARPGPRGHPPDEPARLCRRAAAILAQSAMPPRTNRLTGPTGTVGAAPLPDSGILAAGLPEPRLAAPQASPRWSIPAPGPAMASTDVRGAPRYNANPGAAYAATPPHASGLVVLHAVDDTWIEIKSVKTGRVMFSPCVAPGRTVFRPGSARPES